MARVNWLELAPAMQEWQDYCDHDGISFNLMYCEGSGLWDLETISPAPTERVYIKNVGCPSDAFRYAREKIQRQCEERRAEEATRPQARTELTLTPEQLKAAQATDRVLRTRTKCEVEPVSSRVCSRGTKGCDYYHQD
jgi:hypothetical protein